MLSYTLPEFTCHCIFCYRDQKQIYESTETYYIFLVGLRKKKKVERSTSWLINLRHIIIWLRLKIKNLMWHLTARSLNSKVTLQINIYDSTVCPGTLTGPLSSCVLGPLPPISKPELRAESCWWSITISISGKV